MNHKAHEEQKRNQDYRADGPVNPTTRQARNEFERQWDKEMVRQHALGGHVDENLGDCPSCVEAFGEVDLDTEIGDAPQIVTCKRCGFDAANLRHTRLVRTSPRDHDFEPRS